MQCGKIWLGSTQVAQLSRQAIQQTYTIAGGSAVYASSEFDRCLRDARTAVRHVLTEFPNYEIAGKQFVGLDIRDSPWSFDYRGIGAMQDRRAQPNASFRTSQITRRVYLESSISSADEDHGL